MSTHTPAQAIQELVNHTAVMTERLVGLQQEVRKGMQQTPEWSNALTQVVGDTKRMLQAMEHLARLPAFHLDRDGLNAAVAAGVRMGIAEEGTSLASIIENNSRSLEDAKAELNDAKQRMDQLLGEVQTSRSIKVDAQKRLFAQIAPIAGVWSVACALLGTLIGSSISGGNSAPPPVQPQQQVIQQQQQPAVTPPVTPPAQPPVVPPKPAAQSGLAVGRTIALPVNAKMFDRPSGNPVFNAPKGVRLTIAQVQADGWVQVNFSLSNGQSGTGWIEPGILK